MNNTDDRIWQLIALNLSGEATDEELKELENLLKTHITTRYSKEVIEYLWHVPNSISRQEAEQAYASVLKEMGRRGIVF
jgi:hypothetical protein